MKNNKRTLKNVSRNKSYYKIKSKKKFNANINLNENIIRILTLVKNYYNSQKNTIHVNAYEKAIYQIKKWKTPIVMGKELSKVEGIGKGMIEKIDTIIKTGTLPIILEKNLDTHLDTKDKLILNLKKDEDKNKITNILGFGEKNAMELKKKYNAITVDDIKDLVFQGKIKLTNTQEMGLKYYNDLIDLIPRSEITDIGNKIKQILTISNNYNVNVYLAGSYPSGLKAESKDVDILIVGNPECISLKNMIEDISKNINLETISIGITKYLGLVKLKKKWRHLDMRFVNLNSFPYAWLYYSSGKIFNKIIREKLKKKGYKLNEWGLFKNNKQIDLNLNNLNNKIKITSRDKNNCNSKIQDKDLMKYTELIEKEIFKIAELEYMDVKERY